MTFNTGKNHTLGRDSIGDVYAICTTLNFYFSIVTTNNKAKILFV